MIALLIGIYLAGGVLSACHLLPGVLDEHPELSAGEIAALVITEAVIWVPTWAAMFVFVILERREDRS